MNNERFNGQAFWWSLLVLVALYLAQHRPPPENKALLKPDPPPSLALVPFTLNDLKQKLFPNFHAKHRNFSFPFAATHTKINVSILQKYKSNNSGVGSAVWEGSQVLSTFIARRALQIFDSEQQVVVEIGAGQGLVSITAALVLHQMQLSGRVYATDGDESCLLQAQHNLDRHNLSQVENAAALLVKSTTNLVRWGNTSDVERMLRRPTWVFAADVVFENADATPTATTTTEVGSTALLHEANHAFHALVSTFDILITKDNALLLAYKRRRKREEKFFDLMRAHGFYVQPVKKRYLDRRFRDMFEILCFAKTVGGCSRLGKLVAR